MLLMAHKDLTDWANMLLWKPRNYIRIDVCRYNYSVFAIYIIMYICNLYNLYIYIYN